MKKAGILLIRGLTAASILLCFFIISVRIGVFGKLQTRDDLLNYRGATASLVMSDEGEIVGRFFSENRTNVNFQQLPGFLVDALIATEDIRFYDHNGIDLRSFLRVAVRSVILGDRSGGGGSTISQQLAKNIYGRNRYGILTVPVNKTREIFLAFRIEKTFSKEEILTLYLNTVSFGENVYGIEAASRRYYNKRVEQLEPDESAVLIGMLKANTLYNPRLYPESAVSRRNVVLRQMERYNFLGTEEADSLCSLPLALNYLNLESVNPAGYFLVQVKKEADEILRNLHAAGEQGWNTETDGLIINTTLNLRLQNHAIKSFNDHLPAMQVLLRNQYRGRSGERLLEGITRRELRRLNLDERSGDTVYMRVFDWSGSANRHLTVQDSLMQALTLLHAGLLAMDPASGAIKIWVGGIDYLTQPYDQVLARRQLASAFKPILYAAALEEGIGPCSYYDNDTLILEEYDGWTPVNYDNTYGGQYSMAGALSRSMNVPTFNLYSEIGFEKLNEMWRVMGFTFSLKNTPSLALGTAEANIIETAAAYSTFANGGFKTDPYCIVSIVSPDGEVLYRREEAAVKRRILSESSARLISAMLEKAIDEGTGTSLRNIYGVTIPLAGKTGTSQNYADAWFAAFNPSIVAVSRVGASSMAVHFSSGSYGSGSSLALPLVALTLRSAQRDGGAGRRLAVEFPELPPELKRALDCPDYREMGTFERFIDRLRRKVIVVTGQDSVPRIERRSFIRRLFRR